MNDDWCCENCGADLCYFENCHQCGPTCHECNNKQAMEARDMKVSAELDGHYCYDWDGLAVSAWTPEYDCCVCFKKTWRGRIANWFFMKWFYWQERRCRSKEAPAMDYPLECCGKYEKDCTCK